ncbi:formate dehydrogenase accessory protein FdhE [Pelosinus sp. sgz500959]|uniref:formate dehydrogenase accessory protein FdhE n=1 Tax=Pelosinus sp. sgz500959 TaxID=3242472 RepID=UPI003670E56B
MINKKEFTEILEFLEEHIAQIDMVPADDVLQNLWQTRLANDESALRENEFPLNAAVCLVIEVISDREKKILPTIQAEQLVLRYLDQQSIHPDWQQIGILPENGDIYVHLSCRIALEKMAKLVTDVVSLASWDNKECPVCGDSPAFACLEKGQGKRLLVCGACLTQWRYKRIGCAFCNEENPEKLKIVTAEEFPGWSATVCLTCKGYLKTADLRTLTSTPNWYKAVMETLPLDYALTLHEKST